MQSLVKNKIAFVLPWFGEKIPGGAESEARSLILLLKEYFDVEVLSTCVKDFFSDWNDNSWKPAVYNEMGVVVRRFKADIVDRSEFHQVNRLLMNGKAPNDYEEAVYLSGIIQSHELNDYILEHSSNYQYLFFMPYMFGTSIAGVLSVPEKAVLVPCLHDESYTRMKIFKKLFLSSHRVFFHMETEKKLAEKLYGLNENFRVVGESLDMDFTADAERFIKKYSFENFMIYVGRKDDGKNLYTMIDWFKRYKKESNSKLKLVLIGPGEKINLEKDDIFDLGFVSVQDKYDAISASSFLCNLSLNESFSLVLMEAALLKKAVLVHNDCAVTKEHCLKGNMGLFVKDYYEFSEALSYFEKNLDKLKLMGESGQKYVKENFSRKKVMSNFLSNL